MTTYETMDVDGHKAYTVLSSQLSYHYYTYRKRESNISGATFTNIV